VINRAVETSQINHIFSCTGQIHPANAAEFNQCRVYDAFSQIRTIIAGHFFNHREIKEKQDV
jgi:hypothetical protein